MGVHKRAFKSKYGGLTISPVNESQRVLTVKSCVDFISVETLMSFSKDCIIFKRVPMDWVGKIRHPFNRYGWSCYAVYKRLPICSIDFDEDESNEDKLVAYFEDINEN